MSEHKVFKRYSSAAKAAKSEPIIRIGKFYITGIDRFGTTAIDLIAGTGHICGSISVKSLNRLGNANHIKDGVNHYSHKCTFEGD